MKKLTLLLLLLLATKSLRAQPTVTSFSPASGEIGTVVTITGTNFSAIPEEDIVYFGGVKAQVTAATTHTLTVTVPASASHQPISVTTSNLTAYSATPFIVTFPGGGVITRTTLGPPLLFPLAALRGPIIHADLDGDGKPEIVVLLSDKICLFRNESIPGNISFASKVDIEAPVEGGAIAVADMDGDGKLDLVTVAPYPSGSRISVFRNTSTIGSFNFVPHHHLVDGYFNACAVNDLDGDGKPDLVLSGFGSSVRILRNITAAENISFATDIYQLFENGSIRDIAIADTDEDGKPEIILAVHLSLHAGSSIVVHRNLSSAGELSFSAISRSTGPWFDVGRITLADWNKDQKIDLAVTIINLMAFGNNVIWVLMDNSTPGNPALVGGGYGTEDYPVDLSAGDYDGDGKSDIVYADKGISLWQNMTPIGPGIPYPGVTNFLPKTAFSSIDDDRLGKITPADFDGDGKIDIAATQTDYVTVFRNQTGEPGILSFSPREASVGETVVIQGGNLTMATGVAFGGIAAASFSIVSDTIITAVVGTGASGSVSVSSPSTTSSKTGFTFIPPVVSIADEYVPASDPFEIFPNPVNGKKVTILFNSALTMRPLSLEVTDLTGKVVWSTPVIGNERVTLDDNALASPGLYFIALCLNGKKVIKKIIVTE